MSLKPPKDNQYVGVMIYDHSNIGLGFLNIPWSEIKKSVKDGRLDVERYKDIYKAYGMSNVYGQDECIDCYFSLFPIIKDDDLVGYTLAGNIRDLRKFENFKELQ